MTARRILAALLVTATASLGLAAQPAVAATASASLVVAPDGGGVVVAGGGLNLSLTVTNSGTDALAPGRIAISLDRAPVASTAALLGSIANPSQILLGQLTRADVGVPALAAGASRTVRARITDADLASILTDADGTRLLYARYRSGSPQAVQSVAETSIVRIRSGSTASVGFGTVVPIVAPAGSTGVVPTDAQQQLVGPDGAWRTALQAAQAAPSATVALDPAVIASIRLAGSAASPEAAGFLSALGRLPNQFVRLPYADLDVTLARAADVAPRLGADGFAGAQPPTTTGPTPAPTGTPATSGGGATSTTDLTRWDWSDQTVTWPVPRTVRPSDVAALTSDGGAILLPSDDVRDTAERRTGGPSATVGRARVLVADSAVSALLSTASGSGPTAGAALATLTGLLATAAVTRETTALLATSGRAAAVPNLDRVLSLLGRQPWLRQRSLSQLAAQAAAPAITLRTGSVPRARVATARSLASAEQDVQTLGKAVTADAATVTAPRRLALLGLLSAAWRGNDVGWRAAATRTERAFSAVARKVRVLSGSDNNAIGTDGQLQVSVVNDLPVPVRVRIRPTVSNGRLQFGDASAVTVDIPADSSKLSKLAFRTISNGTTDVTLTLTTPDGATIGAPVRRRVTVTAGFDTVVAVGLLTALGLLLALGVYRNITRRRRPRTAAP